MGFNKQLQELYDMIPEFKCKKGCHECCGMISWLAIEEEPIRIFMKEHNIKYVRWGIDDYLQNQLLCPYLKGDKCIIYEVRPLVCRLYGNSPDLPCPHAKEQKLSKQKTDIIMRKYHTLNTKYIGEKYGAK